jgi:hypothetical protein
LPSFSKHFLVAFVSFQWVTDRKRLFIEVGVFSKFLKPPKPPNSPFQNEAKTKRNRFASEIACSAKSLISLRPKIAEFRGFQQFQGPTRFAKRFLFPIADLAFSALLSHTSTWPTSDHSDT